MKTLQSAGEDSDRDATDDPAPIMPDDEAAPLPDTEIPGSYPTMKRLYPGCRALKVLQGSQ